MNKFILLALVSGALLMTGCDNCGTKYQIIKDDKIIGYSGTAGSADSGCKWYSKSSKKLNKDGRICGDYVIKRIKGKK